MALRTVWSRSGRYVKTGILYVFFGLAALLFDYLNRHIYIGKILFTRPFIFVAVVGVITGIAAILFGYLRGDLTQDSDNEATGSEGMFKDVQHKVLDTEDDILGMPQSRNGLPPSAGPSEQATHEEFANSIASSDISREKAISKVFDATTSRLRGEILQLSRRANLNLVIGVAISTAGIVLLAYLVSRPHDSFASMKDLLSHYIPRITTVALVETFAYFFLQLYKSNLVEVKWYQNELTTMASKEIAWRGSLLSLPPETAREVIRKLVVVDRNSTGSSTEGPKSSDDLEALLDVLQTVTKAIAISAAKKE